MRKRCLNFLYFSTQTPGVFVEKIKSAGLRYKICGRDGNVVELKVFGTEKQLKEL